MAHLAAHLLPKRPDGAQSNGAVLLTERGIEGSTIFDIFSPTGDYEDEFSMPLKIKSRGIGFDLVGVLG